MNKRQIPVNSRVSIQRPAELLEGCAHNWHLPNPTLTEPGQQVVDLTSASLHFCSCCKESTGTTSAHTNTQVPQQSHHSRRRVPAEVVSMVTWFYILRG